jgi:hypothetical protein
MFIHYLVNGEKKTWGRPKMHLAAGALPDPNGQVREIGRKRVRGLIQTNQNGHKRCLKWVEPLEP